MGKAVEQQVGFAAIDGDQFRERKMRGQVRLLRVLPGFDFVIKPWQLVDLLAPTSSISPGRRSAGAHGKGEAIDDFHAVMNS